MVESGKTQTCLYVHTDGCRVARGYWWKTSEQEAPLGAKCETEVPTVRYVQMGRG